MLEEEGVGTSGDAVGGTAEGVMVEEPDGGKALCDAAAEADSDVELDAEGEGGTLAVENTVVVEEIVNEVLAQLVELSEAVGVKVGCEEELGA